MEKNEIINELVKFAESQVGYKEKKSKKDLDSKTANAGANNYTKYAQFFDDLRKKGVDVYNGEKNIGKSAAWCDVFVDYVFVQVCGLDKGLKMLYQPARNSCGAGCRFSAEYFRKNKAIKSTPAVGDVVYFGPVGEENHTGIVVKINAKSFITIEGNKNNQVSRVSHKLTEAVQFGRPDWSIATADEKPAEPTPKPEPAKPSAPAKPAEPDKPNKKVIMAEVMPDKVNKAIAKTYKVATKADPLALRKGPGTNYGKLARMPKGSTVKCEGKHTGPWYFVRYETAGVIYYGFCWGDYLK